MAFDSAGAPETWKLRAAEFDITETYFNFVKGTEPPLHYHRWCLLTSIGALLGRQVYLNMGVLGRFFPNLYVTLMGEPASRKSTSIKIIKSLIRKAGYENFAADKTSKEKFLVDLEGGSFAGDGDPNSIQIKDPSLDRVTSTNLWGGDYSDTEPREVFIAADEFSEFMGNGNLEFYTTLGNLWDWDDEEKPFVQSLKTTRSVSIYQPTISILSGTTAELFSKIFPPEAIGSGFLSRLLLIYGERSGRKVAFPSPADVFLEKQLITYFQTIRSTMKGELPVLPEAKEVLEKIYKTWQEIDDVRFRGYSNRRFTQLLKLTIIISIARFKHQIDTSAVIEANTILTHAEFIMPKALGEFGKSRNSDVASKVMLRLEQALFPLSIKEIWAYVSRDMERQQHLMELLNNLTAAEKVQVVSHQGRVGYLPKKKVRKDPDFINWKLLSAEELDLAGVVS